MRYIIDFKSTKQPKTKDGYEDWAWQLAAYRRLRPDVEGMAILRLDKETGYPEFYDLTDKYESAGRCFDFLLSLYLERKGMPKKMTRATYRTPDDKIVPRVTSIIGQFDKSGALTHWAANCCADKLIELITAMQKTWIHLADIFRCVETARKDFRNVSQKALDIGSEIHKVVEHYLKTGKEPVNPIPEVLSGFLAFLEWLDGYEYTTIATEQTLYGDNYAGTCDWIVDLKKKEEK